jgi:phage-related minor tail protein
VLEQARQLSPDERQALVEELAIQRAQEAYERAPEAAEAAYEAEIEAWLEEADKLAAAVSAAWKDDLSAAEAVKEQRRDL